LRCAEFQHLLQSKPGNMKIHKKAINLARKHEIQ